MPEIYHPESAQELPSSRNLTYRLSFNGEAVILTDHDITLNSLIPQKFFVHHNPDIPLTQSAINNGNILEINLDRVLRTGGFGRSILAHELGHCIDDDFSLVKRRDQLARAVMFGDLPVPERLPAINKVAQIDVQRELSAWGNAGDIAKLIGVTKEEFELMRRLSLKTHCYGALKHMQFAIRVAIKPQPDELLELFDPYTLATKPMTSPKLDEAVQKAEAVHETATREMAAILGE